MELNTIKRVLRVVALLLAVAAMIFVLIAIFSDSSDNTMLTAGLSCVVLSNLFGLVIPMFMKSGQDKN